MITDGFESSRSLTFGRCKAELATSRRKLLEGTNGALLRKELLRLERAGSSFGWEIRERVFIVSC